MKNGNYDIVIYTKFYNKKGSFYETVIDWNGMMKVSETDLAVEILTNNNYKYTTNTTEQITIRITDLKTGQFVDYVCLVRS